MTELPNPLGGARSYFSWRGNRIAYVRRGDGPPMVLVHSIHACAWSMEWRNVMPPLAERFTVYSFDLLGFGASDHPAIHYTAPLYIDLIRDFLAEVVGSPAIVVGSSLGGTYAIAVGATHPDFVRGVCAIGPAGVSRLTTRGGAVSQLVERLFRTPRVGKTLFSALVSKASIRFFLKGIYHDKRMLSSEVVDLFWQSAHQENARLGPAAFVGMQLNCDIRHAVGHMPRPLMLAWGQYASQTPLKESKPILALRSGTPLAVLPSGDLPHEETPAEFVAALLQFVDSID